MENIEVDDKIGIGIVSLPASSPPSSSNAGTDWSCVEQRPASRFAISTRRECKSSSDDTFNIDLNSMSSSQPPPQSSYQQHTLLSHNHHMHHHHHHHHLVSPVKNTQKLTASTSVGATAATPSGHCGRAQTEWMLSIAKLNGGTFGFKPSASTANFASALSYHTRSATSATTTTTTALAATLPHRHIGELFHAASKSREKRTIKRLTTGGGSHLKALGISPASSCRKSDFNHNKKLFHAVSNNDLKIVNEILDTNMFDVNCCDDKQRTCLHIASSRGYLEIVRALLNYGANPNLRDCVDNMAIHLAIIASHVPVVTVLLEAGTDINSIANASNGKTVLHLAGTRLRWLLNDENNKASAKLKVEAIMIMNMIKEYLRRQRSSTSDLDMLTMRLENMFNVSDINSLTKELLDKFETLDLTKVKH